MNNPMPDPHAGNVPPSSWGPGTPPPPPTANGPARRKTWLTHGAVALVALLVGAGIGASGDGGSDATSDAAGKSTPQPAVTVTETADAEAEPAPTVTETETVTAKPKKTEAAEAPGPAASFAGDGEYLVGEDIKAGTYKTAGPEGEFGCYWERAKDASGEFESIIANNNLEGTGRVTLNQGEYFKTNGCQEWKKAG